MNENDWVTNPDFRFRSKELKLPDPVGAKRLKSLALLRNGDRPWNHAAAQFGALYRMGYVRRDGETAQITNAGLAVLERALSNSPQDTPETTTDRSEGKT